MGGARVKGTDREVIVALDRNRKERANKSTKRGRQQLNSNSGEWWGFGVSTLETGVREERMGSMATD